MNINDLTVKQIKNILDIFRVPGDKAEIKSEFIGKKVLIGTTKTTCFGTLASKNGKECVLKNSFCIVNDYDEKQDPSHVSVFGINGRTSFSFGQAVDTRLIYSNTMIVCTDVAAQSIEDAYRAFQRSPVTEVVYEDRP